jgi:fused signal recognition particle receptor
LFDRLRSAISSITTVASQKTLKTKDVQDILFDFEIALLESDVAQEVAEALTKKVKEAVTGRQIDRSITTEEYVKNVLQEAIKEVLSEVHDINLLGTIKEKGPNQVFKIVFLGINGTGKTTTIAKVAKLLKDNGFTVVIACADTYRAGAIEQLTEHAERLSVKAITQRYGADPAAVARDAVLYAQRHRVDVVLIDTAGRMQTSRNLMEEMEKIVRVVNPDLKIFVGDALAGNDAVSQAKAFSDYTGFDAVILTKADADAKGGSALSIAHVSGKPIIFLGVGQDYDSLILFDIDRFISTIFRVG